MPRGRDEERYSNAKKLLGEKRYEEAFQAYRMLANAGDPQCQVFLGWMYHEGLGTARDVVEARAWFEKAAVLGSKEGAFYCGRSAAASGKQEEAVEWFRKAASQEYGPALLWLGLAYVRGHGAPEDLPRGIAYLELAAKTGSYFAKRELAWLMIRGRLGVSSIPIGAMLLPYSVIAGIVSALWKGDSDKLIG
jgi:TPR repeat protein